jgi:G3E family GTPase
MIRDNEQFSSLYIFTGFLGSGKTTLIANLLRQPEMHGTSIIVNEFGSIGIDDAIFAETIVRDRIYLLSNGCLCCAPGDDLLKSVNLLLAPENAPRRIIIETSGLADPAALIQRLLSDRNAGATIRVRGIVATVDGVNGQSTLEKQMVSRRQAALADQRIVTKADIAEPIALERLSRQLLHLNPGASVRFASNGDVNAAELIDELRFDPFDSSADLPTWFNEEAYNQQPVLHTSSRFLADAGICSWTIRSDRELNWPIFSGRLMAIVAQYGDVLLRLKGIVHTVGETMPYVVHAVQRLFHPPIQMACSAVRNGCSIVMIGEPGTETAVELMREAVQAAETPSNNSSLWRRASRAAAPTP